MKDVIVVFGQLSVIKLMENVNAIIGLYLINVKIKDVFLILQLDVYAIKNLHHQTY